MYPRHGHGAGHLVPVELVEHSDADEIVLSCAFEEFEALEPAEETQFLPGATGEWSYGQGEMFSSPYFGLGRGIRIETTYDRVPVGEVEVRSGEPVHASDGDIGHVRGLVIDPVTVTSPISCSMRATSGATSASRSRSRRSARCRTAST